MVYNISPRVDTGIHVEKRIKSDGTVQTVASLYAGGMPFGTVTTVQPPNNGTQTTYTRYFHTDHLGSIVALTNESGAVTERRSYDAWGKRRNSNGTPMTSAFVTPDERHGFTVHEEWDEVGLIHMNGRLYDPTTGRFLSADPSIQYADDMQNYNRYSYINNNPLSAVDYSGYGFFKSVFKGIRNAVRGVGRLVSSALKNPTIRTIASIAAAYYTGYYDGGIFGNAIANGAAGGFAGGLVAGRGDLKVAIQGAITGAVFGQIGDWADAGEWGKFARTMAHAAGGCATSAIGGGSCSSGALAAGFGQAAERYGFAGDWGRYGNIARNAILGGTASVLGGGKFENGAMTAAFARLFNDMQLHGNQLNTRESCPGECTLVSLPDGQAWVPIGVSAEVATKAALGDPRQPTKAEFAQALAVTGAVVGTGGLILPAGTIAIVFDVIGQTATWISFGLDPTAGNLIDAGLGYGAKGIKLLHDGLGDAYEKIINIKDWANATTDKK